MPLRVTLVRLLKWPRRTFAWIVAAQVRLLRMTGGALHRLGCWMRANARIIRAILRSYAITLAVVTVGAILLVLGLRFREWLPHAATASSGLGAALCAFAGISPAHVRGRAVMIVVGGVLAAFVN